MGLIVFVFVLALAISLPVKCYSDGQYKIKCLEMHGTLTEKGQDPFCDVSDSKKKSADE